MSLLEVEHLTKVFRSHRMFRRGIEHRAVDDVSFVLEAGSTVAVVGESGAGKSTTARLVLRLIDPDGGVVRFNGEDVLALSRNEMRIRRRDMQMIFQDPYGSLDPRHTVLRSVAEPLKVHMGMNRTDREAAALALLERVGLGRQHANRLPAELSGGQLQRISIARALTMNPKMIVCDEAVAALDVSVRAQVLNLLLDIQEERGVSYLFIAHDLAIVEAFADHTVVMKDGAVVEQGTVDQLFRNPQSQYTKELLAAIPVPDPQRRRPREPAPEEGASRVGQ